MEASSHRVGVREVMNAFLVRGHSHLALTVTPPTTAGPRCPPLDADGAASHPEHSTGEPEEDGSTGPPHDRYRLAKAPRRMGLEGLVSKHRDRPYQAGRSKHWIKVKNREHPAVARVQEAHRRA